MGEPQTRATVGCLCPIEMANTDPVLSSLWTVTVQLEPADPEREWAP